MVTSLPQERIFSASWLGERKYAEPSQLLKEILKKKNQDPVKSSIGKEEAR